MFAFQDTPFDPDHPLYSRSEALSLLPGTVAPLAWSLVGPAFERGFRQALGDDLGLVGRPGPERPYQFVGRHAARAHLNLTLLAQAIQRLPGGDTDLHYLVNLPTDLPDGRTALGDRRARFKASPAIGRTLAGIGRRINRDRQHVDELVGRVDELAHDLDDGSAPATAVAWALRDAVALLGELAATHVAARGLVPPVVDQALAALARADIDHSDAVVLVTDIDELASLDPTSALLELAGLATASPSLRELVRSGDHEALAGSDAPGAAMLQAALDAFLHEFGHRGPHELDPTVPAWADRPGEILTLAASLEGVRLPEPEAEPAPADPGRMARPLVAAARGSIARAERTRDHLARCASQLRRLVDLLRPRLVAEVGDHVALLLIDEIEAHLHGASLPAPAELDRRRDDLARAMADTVAGWSDGHLRLDEPDPSSAPPVTLTGVGCSAGTVEAVARVRRAPHEPVAAGEVLVVRAAEAAWLPRFPTAGAVVTEAGSSLGHAAVAARNLGVPMVVGVAGAVTRITDGARVRVDANAGTVDVLG